MSQWTGNCLEHSKLQQPQPLSLGSSFDFFSLKVFLLQHVKQPLGKAGKGHRGAAPWWTSWAVHLKAVLLLPAQLSATPAKVSACLQVNPSVLLKSLHHLLSLQVSVRSQFEIIIVALPLCW